MRGAAILPILTALIVTPPLNGSAQEIWSLERCIEYGLEHNLELKGGEISILRAESEYTGSKLSLIPSINLTNAVMIGAEKSFIPRMDISATLFDGLKRYYRIKSGSTSVEIGEQEYLDTQDNIIISITRSYLDVLLTQELKNVAQMSYDNIQEQLLKQSVMFEAGKCSHSSLLDIESQKSSEMVELINLNNQLKSYILKLTQTMNYPYSEDFIISDYISDQEISPIDPDIIDSVYIQALQLPYIKSARLAIKQRGYEKGVASASILPSLTLDVGYDIKRGDKSIMLGLSIPIFNQGSALNSIKQATLEEKRAKIELSRRENELYKEIQLAVHDGIRYYQEYQASLKHLEAAEASFRYQSEKLEVGLITTIDYNYSKNKLINAHSKVVQAKYRYLFQLKIIEYYKGETY